MKPNIYKGKALGFVHGPFPTRFHFEIFVSQPGYTLSEARNRHGQVFDQAAVEPILLTKQSRPSHVLMSAESYHQLIDRLTKLEDMLLGQAAKEAVNQSQMVGSETFVQTLQELANGENGLETVLDFLKGV